MRICIRIFYLQKKTAGIFFLQSSSLQIKAKINHSIQLCSFFSDIITNERWWWWWWWSTPRTKRKKNDSKEKNDHSFRMLRNVFTFSIENRKIYSVCVCDYHSHWICWSIWIYHDISHNIFHIQYDNVIINLTCKWKNEW